jgi:hypothetical protein
MGYIWFIAIGYKVYSKDKVLDLPLKAMVSRMTLT